MATMSYKNLLDRPELQTAAELFAKACAASRAHSRLVARAEKQYGDHGPVISGIQREHFPDAVKDQLRTLARDVTRYLDAAYAARPNRVHSRTMVHG
jgi:hypothetical protein